MAEPLMKRMSRRRQGFTLIEMSVVLVIIGLLAAGIMVGQTMKRNSQVLTIIQDVATYQSAIAQFKQKFGELPGDMADAQTYWGVNPNCTTNGGVGTGTQTCNGNGDGSISYTNSPNPPYEQFLVWQHLVNAGLITGQYTGTSITTATNPRNNCQPTVNCPGGRLNSAQAYFIEYVTGPLIGLAPFQFLVTLPFQLGFGENEGLCAAAGEDVEHPECFFEIWHSPPRLFCWSSK
jgi:prepilin-type N-terminal cleavage/methylation domain-containing protein